MRSTKNKGSYILHMVLVKHIHVIANFQQLYKLRLFCLYFFNVKQLNVHPISLQSNCILCSIFSQLITMHIHVQKIDYYTQKHCTVKNRQKI